MAEHNRKTELINRIALRDALYEADAVTMAGVKIINQFPAVDAVEVVRCKDCKHTKTDECEDPAIYCKKWDRWEMPEDFFCGYGERKPDEA